MLDHSGAFWVPIEAPKGLVLAQNSPILGKWEKMIYGPGDAPKGFK